MSGLFSFFGNLFGGSSDPFAGHDPNNLEMYWLLEHELSQVDDGAKDIKAVLAEYNLKSRNQAENVMGAYAQRHQANPAFNQAAVTVQTRIQMGEYHKMHGQG